VINIDHNCPAFAATDHAVLRFFSETKFDKQACHNAALRSGVKAMHASKAPDQDDTRRPKRSTGPPSISTAAFEGAIDRPILRHIGYATKCTECHVLREKEELFFRLFGLHDAAEKRLANLTLREGQIMKLVLSGQPSKNIAADLGISQRTVENHRASIMKRTGSKSLPELARLAIAADWTMPVAQRGNADAGRSHQ
jgi:DNA-binding CsgD family transcriptional regulator